MIFFLDGVLHQLGLVVNIQLAHQVELVGLDGLDAELEGGGDLFDGLAFGEHFEDSAFAFGERAEARFGGQARAPGCGDRRPRRVRRRGLR